MEAEKLTLIKSVKAHPYRGVSIQTSPDLYIAIYKVGLQPVIKAKFGGRTTKLLNLLVSVLRGQKPLKRKS
jgi:hypothetical protein